MVDDMGTLSVTLGEPVVDLVERTITIPMKFDGGLEKEVEISFSYI